MRKLRFRDASAESTFDLNLAPMMDMLVTIIPFMLLSATFMQLMLIDMPLPVPVAQALANDRAQQQREVTISVNMSLKGGFSLEIKEPTGSISRLVVPAIQGEGFDYKTLHKKLVEIKHKYPKVFRLELNPDEKIDYQSIVKVMDATRTLDKDDKKVVIDGAETTLMFPDVVLSNVMG